MRELPLRVVVLESKITLEFNPGGFQVVGYPTPAIKEWLFAYAAGSRSLFEEELELNLPPFTTAVLKHLQTVPYNQLVTYGELGAKVGNRQAARAVGNACHRNPFPLLIPCHRVIGSCTLGGFAYSPAIKSLLLDFEQSHQLLPA